MSETENARGLAVITMFFVFMIMTSAMLVAAYRDLTSMIIPNWISLFLIGAFVVLLPFNWPGMEGLMEHFAAGGTMFLAGFVMFALGWLGGGDAKLMAATSLWWQWPDLLLYVIYVTLAGGCIALFMLVGRKYAPIQMANHPLFYNLLNNKEHMPYGLALAIGALATLPQSKIFLTSAGIM